jgi:hypothetical protein
MFEKVVCEWISSFIRNGLIKISYCNLILGPHELLKICCIFLPCGNLG